MTTFSAQGITLEKLREHVWKIPQEDSMRVPAIVLASETLLEEIGDDKTLQQLKNTTELPGIQQHAICMPDGHQGYGFPVGGVAGIDAETGCISPGAVGYDINCLSGDTDVLLEFGRRESLESVVHQFEGERAVVSGESMVPSEIVLATETSGKTVYEIETLTGETIKATEDHPFLTPDGMVDVHDLSEGDSVYVNPFRGFPNEELPEFVVLDEADFKDEDPQLIDALEERGLLPLYSTDDELNHLLKLLGYFTGDGSFNDTQTCFYGAPEDVEAIKESIEAVGFTSSKVYNPDREHGVNSNEFDTKACSVRLSANAFKQLLIRLGAPEGSKITSDYELPSILNDLADWQKALYISGLFGAELSSPAAMTTKNLNCPEFTHTRAVANKAAGKQFIKGLVEVLQGLGVRTNAISQVAADSNSQLDTIQFRFGIKNESPNLIRFFTTIGYRFQRAKQKRGLQSAQYLKRKQRVIDRRSGIEENAGVMTDGGSAQYEMKHSYNGVNNRVIERDIWSEQKDKPRPPLGFPSFEEYCDKVSVRNNLTVETEIASITECGVETVYDIGVRHDAHNFLANGFVVSNCGVRMVKTNLEYSDVQGHEEELVDALFDRIPSGLGGGGIVEGSIGAVNAILDRGMEWAVEEGYATRDDLLHCEDEGFRPESDPSMVSQNAKDRGKNQIGSLGSGNHFLEVQRVTDVFRDDVGAAFGLSEDQIVVLIHCGSRGLGHQTCTDYLRKIEKEHSELLDKLPDKELAAAPAGSQLAEEYYQAMGAAINYAWVNRQLIMHAVREVFSEVFGQSWEALEIELLYDVAHNIAKKERHLVNGEERELFVHRKGATRAFPAGHEAVPRAYRSVGQPIIIPGSMGSGSYVLRGGEEAMGLTFGSTAHGAGRVMSRTQAKKEYWGEDVRDDLREQSKVFVKAQSGATIAEEAPGVYKDVDEVVRLSDELGIGDKVARTYPVCNIKG